MTGSTGPLTPGIPATAGPVPGVGVSAEPSGRSRSGRALVDAVGQFLPHRPHGAPAAGSSTTVGQAVARAGQPDYPRWLAHTASAAGCAHPVRLAGTTTTVDAGSGAVWHRLDTRTLPDATLYTACGNRRAAVCPACAETYRADTFHLVAAGITGAPGKGCPSRWPAIRACSSR